MGNEKNAGAFKKLRRFSFDAFLCLLLGARRNSGGSGCARVVESGGVLLNEFLHFAMSPASIEDILLHLGVRAIVVPAVMIETIDGTHHARAMTSTRAMHIKLTS